VIDVADPEFGEGPWSAMLMTSANAARAIGSHPRMPELFALPVLAVGERTAAAAKEAGFSNVRSSDGDAGDLVRLARAQCDPGGDPILYLAGEDRARDIAAELAVEKFQVEEVVVYRAEAAEAFPPAALAALTAGGADIALHYSRRSAETFLRCADRAGLRSQLLALAHFCLSDRAATPLTQAGAHHIRVAREPREEALLDLLGPA
jgi:uroporphyrinogen-III synthase